jgi:hypothetical protein
MLTEFDMDKIQIEAIKLLRGADLSKLRFMHSELSEHLKDCVQELSKLSEITTVKQSAQLLGELKALVGLMAVGIDRIVYERRWALRGSDCEHVIRVLLNGPATFHEIREALGESMQFVSNCYKQLASLRLVVLLDQPKPAFMLTEEAAELAKELGILDHVSYIDKIRNPVYDEAEIARVRALLNS